MLAHLKFTEHTLRYELKWPGRTRSWVELGLKCDEEREFMSLPGAQIAIYIINFSFIQLYLMVSWIT